MSWSFYATGKPAAVLKKAQTELPRIHCVEPEETIKNKVGDILMAALLAMPEVSAVRVEAAGSQSTKDGKAVNQLLLKIEPIYGFVE